MSYCKHCEAPASTCDCALGRALEGSAMTKADLDKLVCGWSMLTETPLSDDSLNALVDILYQKLGGQEIAQLKARVAEQEDALLACARYFQWQDDGVEGGLYGARKAAVYLTNRALDGRGGEEGKC